MKALKAAIMGMTAVLGHVVPVLADSSAPPASAPVPAQAAPPIQPQSEPPPEPPPDPVPASPKPLPAMGLTPETDSPAPVVMPKAPTRHVPARVAQGVLGQEVQDADGKSIGRMADVIVDTKGTPVAALIDVGGFLGVGDRRIAIEWKQLNFHPDQQEHTIVLNMTPDQLKSAPEYKDGEGGAILSPSEPDPAAAAKKEPPAAEKVSPQGTQPGAGAQPAPGGPPAAAPSSPPVKEAPAPAGGQP